MTSSIGTECESGFHLKRLNSSENDQNFLLDSQFAGIIAENVLILFFAMVTVGLSGEIIFRGFILPHLIKGTRLDQSLAIPIFLSAAFFGVLHFLNIFQTFIF